MANVAIRAYFSKARLTIHPRDTAAAIIDKADCALCLAGASSLSDCGLALR